MTVVVFGMANLFIDLNTSTQSFRLRSFSTEGMFYRFAMCSIFQTVEFILCVLFVLQLRIEHYENS